MALVHLGDGAYGVRIRDEARTGRVVSPGAVYTALDRMERRGLVSSRLGEPTPQRGGKRKRYLPARAGGGGAAARVHDALARMARGLRPKLEAP
jgi:hypothetical protein